MIKRYELSETQWQRIADLLPGKTSDPGRTGTDNRLFVNGVLWVLRSGARWHDLKDSFWCRICPFRRNLHNHEVNEFNSSSIGQFR